MILADNVRIVSSHRVVKSMWLQATGLMFRTKLRDFGWVFVFSYKSFWHVTNLFVFQTIDVLWLDEQKRVLQTTTVKPFMFFVRGVRGTQYVIELPAGTAQMNNIGLGARISWK